MGWLRLLFALAIVVGHAEEDRPAGWFPYLHATEHDGAIKLHFFFVLSGFFVKAMLDGRLAAARGANLRFWASRFVRLMPGYYVVLAATLVLWAGTGLVPRMVDQMSLPIDVRAGLIRWIVRNLTFLDPSFANPFILRTAVNPRMFAVGPTWSLANEWLFLLAAPFLLRNNRVLAVATVVSIGLHGLYVELGVYRNHIWAEGAYFMLGAVAYLAYQRFLRPHRHRWPWVGWAAAVATMAATITYGAWSVLLPIQLAHELFVALVLVTVPLMFAFIKPNRIEQRAGDMAFPVYLSHMLVITALRATDLPKTWVLLTSLPIILVYGWLAVQFIDAPLKAVRRQIESPPERPVPVTSATVTLTTSVSPAPPL